MSDGMSTSTGAFARARLHDFMTREACATLDGALDKGVPCWWSGQLATVAEQGWRIGDGSLPTPFAVVKADVVNRNLEQMMRFVASTGVSLAPHGKTTMAPHLVAAQLEAGSWGVTAATVQQAAFFAGMGATRIIIANEVTSEADLRALAWVMGHYDDVELFVLVDSSEGVQRLSGAAERAGRPVGVLVEVGAPGGRTGCRDEDVAVALARSVHQDKALVLAGVEAYEGAVKGETPSEEDAKIDALLEAALRVAERCDADALWDRDEVVLSAGGSRHFDVCVTWLKRFSSARPVRVVLRSGCYLTSDDGGYGAEHRLLEARNPDHPVSFTPAIEVWGAVVSMPEPGLAFVDVGKRDASHDWGLPVPRRVVTGDAHEAREVGEGWSVRALNDQHAYVSVPPGSALAVGDLVGFGISHPCTTFDKWRVLFCVDAADRVTGAFRTFF